MKDAERSVDILVRDACCYAAGVNMLTMHKPRIQRLPVCLESKLLVMVPYTCIDDGSICGGIGLQLCPLQSQSLGKSGSSSDICKGKIYLQQKYFWVELICCSGICLGGKQARHRRGTWHAEWSAGRKGGEMSKIILNRRYLHLLEGLQSSSQLRCPTSCCEKGVPESLIHLAVMPAHKVLEDGPCKSAFALNNQSPLPAV